MKLKYNSPGDLPLAKYLKTLEIFNDTSLSDLDKNVEILAIYADTTVDSILKLRPEEVGAYMAEMSEAISSYKPSNSKRPKKIKINDQVYTINYNVGKLNMAQYIDFQQIIIKKNYLENLPALLSIFIIPKGHKYNDDYDILELRNILETNMTLDEALSIVFFFENEIDRFNKNQTAVLQSDVEDYEMDDKGQADEGDVEDGGESAVDPGEQFNRYLSLIDEVSEVLRQPFNETWEMNIYAFFTYAAYSRWKTKKQQEAIARWQNKKLK